MNFYSIIAFIIASVVFFFGLKLATSDLKMFWDIPSLFIVFGGTLASAAISFQINHLGKLVKIYVLRMFFGKKIKISDTVVEMIKMADNYRKGESFETLAKKTHDPFLAECLNNAAEGIIEKENLPDLFMDRAEKMLGHYTDESKKIKTLAKYPPAFGMMGTTIGMIVLLANLGGEDALKMIGPAMGVCLITTLYGVTVANFLVIPVGENLSDNAKDIYQKNLVIVEGMSMLLEKANPIVVAVKLNSFLTPSERVDWKSTLGR